MEQQDYYYSGLAVDPVDLLKVVRQLGLEVEKNLGLGVGAWVRELVLVNFEWGENSRADSGFVALVQPLEPIDSDRSVADSTFDLEFERNSD